MALFKEKLTTAGRTMYANMLAGNIQIHFTKIVMGDGMVSEAAQAGLTAVVSQKVTLDSPYAKINGDNTVVIYSLFDNTALTSGFYFREKGLYASDGKKEILFAYGNNGSLAEWIDPPATGLVQKKISTIISYSEGDTINIALNSEGFVPSDVDGNAERIRLSDGTNLPNKIDIIDTELKNLNEKTDQIPDAVTVVNTLTETVPGKALDAVQGKYLDDNKQNKIDSALNTANKTIVGAINENSQRLTTHTGDETNPHGVTASQVGLGNVSNATQMPLAGGTFTGMVTAQNNTSYTTKQIRNITLSTASASGGGNGDVWFKYV